MVKKYVIPGIILISFMSGCVNVTQAQNSNQTTGVNQSQPSASVTPSNTASPTPAPSVSPFASTTPSPSASASLATSNINVTGIWTGSYFTTIPCSISLELSQNNADVYTPITGGGVDCAGLFTCSGTLVGNQLTLTTNTGAIFKGTITGNTITATVTNAFGLSYALSLIKS